MKPETSATETDEMERKLSDLLQGASGEPPRQVTVAGVRRGLVRRAVEAVAGTAAMAAVIFAAVPALGRTSGSHSPRAAAEAGLAHPVIAYVANTSAAPAGTVTPIRTATNTPLPRIKAGRNPEVIAITPDGKTAYVACDNHSGTVTPIRTATNTARPPIKTGFDTANIAITPDGKTAYGSTSVTSTTSSAR